MDGRRCGMRHGTGKRRWSSCCWHVKAGSKGDYADTAVVKLLLARNDVGADLKDNNGRTPLWNAAWKGHEAVVKLLQPYSTPYLYLY